MQFPVDRQPETAFTSNKARAALIIPARFGHDIARGITSPVQMLIDASDSNTARLVNGYAAEITAAWNTDHGGGGGRAAPVQAAIRFLVQPPDDRSKKVLRTRIFVLGLSLFPAAAGRARSVRKKASRRPSSKEYVSSISAREFLLGKILTFVAVAFCECLLLLTLLFTYFGLDFAGDPSCIIVATILYAFCVASFGTLIGSAIPNQQVAMQMVDEDAGRLSAGVHAFRPGST